MPCFHVGLECQSIICVHLPGFVRLKNRCDVRFQRLTLLRHHSVESASFLRHRRCEIWLCRADLADHDTVHVIPCPWPPIRLVAACVVVASRERISLDGAFGAALRPVRTILEHQRRSLGCVLIGEVRVYAIPLKDLIARLRNHLEWRSGSSLRHLIRITTLAVGQH